jgi:hypothetical protein
MPAFYIFAPSIKINNARNHTITCLQHSVKIPENGKSPYCFLVIQRHQLVPGMAHIGNYHDIPHSYYLYHHCLPHPAVCL